MNDRVLNMSTALGFAPITQRPGLARQLGYTRVESWWDFDCATPPQQELEAFVAAVRQAGVELVTINSHGGDRAGGERGLACYPNRVDEFKASIESVCHLADALGPRKFNVTFGEVLPNWSPQEQLAQAVANYRWAAQRVARFGGTILVEALSGKGCGQYPFTTGIDVVDFLETHFQDVENVGFLFDTFHLTANGQDILNVWDKTAAYVKHLQLADFPGRGEPGSGELPLNELLQRAAQAGYQADIALEYVGKPVDARTE